MRQLKTFMRNRKEDMLGCGECTCYTLQCWRNSDVNCGCGGGAVQELEIMPVPDTPGMFSIHMPDEDYWVIGIDESGPIIIVMDVDKLVANNLFGFIISPEDATGDIQWEYIVNEEVFNSISNTLSETPQEGGKLSAKDSKVILDMYKDLINTTVILKNPRFEQDEETGFSGDFMDVYSLKTNSQVGVYNVGTRALTENLRYPKATLINEDMKGWLDSVFTSREDWVIDDYVIVPYEYSKSFKEVLKLSGLHSPIQGGDEYFFNVYNGICDWIYDIDGEGELVDVGGGFDNWIDYQIDDTVETWTSLWNDCSYVAVTKENDVFSISTESETLQPLVSVLEGVKNSTLGAMFYQCLGGNYYFTEAFPIFWEVYLEPTQANISQAINKLDALADAEIALAECVG